MSFDMPSVGSRIRVTTRFPNYYLPTADTQPWDDKTFEGLVVPAGKWDQPNTFCMTGDENIAVRNIAMHRIVRLEVLRNDGVASPMVASRTAESGSRAFLVKSASNTYLVTLTKNKYSCSCIGYQYHRNCRHVKGVAAKIQANS